MSFILDALKKSEAERQRKHAPGVADIPPARDVSAPPRWLWAVGALLAINLVVVLALLLRGEGQPEPTAAAPVPATEEAGPEEAAAAATAASPEERAPEPSFSEMVAAAREYSTPPAERSTDDGERDAGRSIPPAGDGAADPAAEAPANPAAEQQPRRQSAVEESLPTFNSLRAGGSLQLPDLHLDIHVYSERPAERFVFVNMGKYKEKETLSEGPAVREIIPEGVVLEHRGQRFLLPRD